MGIMPYDPRAIANYFLDLADASGELVSPMKMQKLVYYAHGWYLALKDKPLLDEQIEAWSYGPVVRSLYRELRDYGDRPITKKLTDRRMIVRDGHYRVGTPEMSTTAPGDDFARTLLDRVWELYSPYTAVQLSNATHEPGSPWDQVYEKYTKDGGKILKGTDIPAESIRDYFRSRLRNKVDSK